MRGVVLAGSELHPVKRVHLEVDHCRPKSHCRRYVNQSQSPIGEEQLDTLEQHGEATTSMASGQEDRADSDERVADSTKSSSPSRMPRTRAADLSGDHLTASPRFFGPNRSITGHFEFPARNLDGLPRWDPPPFRSKQH